MINPKEMKEFMQDAYYELDKSFLVGFVNGRYGLPTHDDIRFEIKEFYKSFPSDHADVEEKMFRWVETEVIVSIPDGVSVKES